MGVLSLVISGLQQDLADHATFARFQRRMGAAISLMHSLAQWVKLSCCLFPRKTSCKVRGH